MKGIKPTYLSKFLHKREEAKGEGVHFGTLSRKYIVYVYKTINSAHKLRAIGSFKTEKEAEDYFKEWKQNAA